MQLFNGDALEYLKKIPDNSIDYIVTDVPYRVTTFGTQGTMGGYWAKQAAKSGKIFDYNDIKPSEYLPDFFRVLKDKSICNIMINNLNLQEMLNEATKVGFNFVKSIIWDKQLKICGRYYMGCYEHILLFRKGGDRPINDCSTPDILSIPINKIKDEQGNNLHDTEKPVKLLETLILNSSNEGDTVLDPFMGIGSAGIACRMHNRNFIGIEIDKKYFDIAQNRINGTEIKKEFLQGELF